MELLARPKTVYLLEADLEVLHDESREWLNDVKFWRDEIAFFYTLMLRKTAKDPSSEDKNEIGRIQEELLRLSGNEFTNLEKDINAHESYLASLMLSSSVSSDREFREKHRTLLINVQAFFQRIRKLKNEVFLLIKKGHF